MLLETGEVGQGREAGGGESRVGAGVYKEREGCMRGAQSNADGSSMLRCISRTATVLSGSGEVGCATAWLCCKAGFAPGQMLSARGVGLSQKRQQCDRNGISQRLRRFVEQLRRVDG